MPKTKYIIEVFKVDFRGINVNITCHLYTHHSVSGYSMQLKIHHLI